MLIGRCGKESLDVVLWYAGDGISVPAANVLIIADTRDLKEALEICKNNLANFIAR